VKRIDNRNRFGNGGGGVRKLPNFENENQGAFHLLKARVAVAMIGLDRSKEETTPEEGGAPLTGRLLWCEKKQSQKRGNWEDRKDKTGGAPI